MQGTTVITNLSSVLKDESVWKKPNEFYPEHFLDVNGQFVKPEAFMPFSAGKSEGMIWLQAMCTAGAMIYLLGRPRGAFSLFAFEQGVRK